MIISWDESIGRRWRFFGRKRCAEAGGDEVIMRDVVGYVGDRQKCYR